MFSLNKRNTRKYKSNIALIIAAVVLGLFLFYWESSTSLRSGVYPLRETGVYFIDKIEENGSFKVKIPILYVRKNPFQFSTPSLSDIELYNSENELIAEYDGDYQSVVFSKGILDKEAHGEIELTINGKTIVDKETGEVKFENYFRNKYDHVLKTIIFNLDGQRYYYKLGEMYNVKAFESDENFYEGPKVTNVTYKEKKGDNEGYIIVSIEGVKNYTLKKSFLWFQDEEEKLLESPIYYKKGDMSIEDIPAMNEIKLPYICDDDHLTLVYKVDEKVKEYLDDKVAIINPYYMFQDAYENRGYIGNKTIVVSQNDIAKTAIEHYKTEEVKEEKIEE